MIPNFDYLTRNWHTCMGSLNHNINRIAGIRCVEAVILILLSILIASCGTTSTNKEVKATPGKSEIVITGAVNHTFTSDEVSAFKVADAIGLHLVEKFPCGVSLQFKGGTKPGKYPIEDHFHSLSSVVYGEYSPDCGQHGSYLSKSGTLELTSVEKKFSGKFQFTAALNNDESKTVNISGTFTDITVP
jgi:hypothetical protein